MDERFLIQSPISLITRRYPLNALTDPSSNTYAIQINTFNYSLNGKYESRDQSLVARHDSLDPQVLSQRDASSLDIYSSVNLASIAEGVTDVVCAGHAREQKATSIPFAMEFDSSDTTHSSTTSSPSDDNVIITLDISPGDWVFTCTPGAVQRILMNLVGNSLKYTKRGSIKIELENTRIEQPQPESQEGEPRYTMSEVTLRVIDTGIGMSEDFLRHKLYTPFSQETTLAAGTGMFSIMQ